MQETKLADDDVPTEDFLRLGYEIAHHGEGRWNGVAIASRVGIRDIVTTAAPRSPARAGTLRARLRTNAPIPLV